jgi:hypothetical protein
MTKGAYLGNGGLKTVKEIYYGVGGIRRKVKEAYIGRGGVKQWWPDNMDPDTGYVFGTWLYSRSYPNFYVYRHRIIPGNKSSPVIEEVFWNSDARIGYIEAGTSDDAWISVIPLGNYIYHAGPRQATQDDDRYQWYSICRYPA